VLDANEAFLAAPGMGFEMAKEMYTEAATTQRLTTCWNRPNELAELKNFSLFRLALIAAYRGLPEEAAEAIAQLEAADATGVYSAMGAAWLSSYQTSGDVKIACADMATYGTNNPAVVEILADYGYANPSFSAADVCPILDVDAPTLDTAATATEVATEAAAATEEATTAAEEATPEATEDAAATEEATAEAVATTAPIPGQAGELPECPTTLDTYATELPSVIAIAAGDPLIVEAWLRICDGMADDRGGLLLADFNGDTFLDGLFLPVIISDLGFGPEGAQGAVLLYHGKEDGSMDLVYAPEIYGQPAMLGSGDLNGDGAFDLAWTVEGCSTFCVKEVQMISWDAGTGDYEPIITPGATIASGTAVLEERAEGDTAPGKILLLSGGVSGTSEGGLEAEHTERWEAVNGIFRRLSWSYDRDAAGANCLGLRLVEADAALNAADVLGFGLAAELYQASLDPALSACSIYGIPATEELTLLQGLASFRLIQTLTLSGTVGEAETVLTALTAGQPDSAFTKAATQWLSEYQSSGDPVAACKAIQILFDQDTRTWQITDHFGYNHPALSSEQVCFKPPA
jgi:hypothetical protein